MAFKLKRSSREPMSEINVTPFVDVMLVLLIIFMVTAPLLTVGVQVDLPESSADSLPEDQEPLTLTINSKGEIFIQEYQVEYNKMIPKILAITKNRPEYSIKFRRYGKLNCCYRPSFTNWYDNDSDMINRWVNLDANYTRMVDLRRIIKYYENDKKRNIEDFLNEFQEYSGY